MSGGGGGGANLEKRLVSFIDLIVDNKMIILSPEFMFRLPYKHKRDWFLHDSSCIFVEF